MPWNDNQGGGQGPWGSGGGNNNGQNPWGQRPNGGGGGGGDQPPDLDEVVRQMQNSLGRMFGGKGGGAGGDGKKGGGVFSFGLIVLVLIGVWFASSGWYQVGPNENGVVLRFGEYSRTTQPGLHFKLPLGIDSVVTVPVRRQLKLEFGFSTPGASNPYQGAGSRQQQTNEKSMVTGDLNAALVEWVVQYHIDDAPPLSAVDAADLNTR